MLGQPTPAGSYSIAGLRCVWPQSTHQIVRRGETVTTRAGGKEVEPPIWCVSFERGAMIACRRWGTCGVTDRGTAEAPPGSRQVLHSS